VKKKFGEGAFAKVYHVLDGHGDDFVVKVCVLFNSINVFCLR